MRYYTLKKQVPLADGQIVKFTPGRGYYPDFPNPSVFRGHTPPVHVPPPAPHVLPPAATKAQQMVGWAHWGLDHAANFDYTEGPGRSQMFDTHPGTIPAGGEHADCSQFYAACEHWSGGTICNDSDYTGTLLQKGRAVTNSPKLWLPSFCVIFGPETGTHAAMLTERNGATDWWTIGFGHSPGAPDRVALSVMTAWMINHGHPGVRVLSFL